MGKIRPACVAGRVVYRYEASRKAGLILLMRAMKSRMKAGMSSGLREVTKLPSATTF